MLDCTVPSMDSEDGMTILFQLLAKSKAFIGISRTNSCYFVDILYSHRKI
jgi:hypothetical protein